jgi:serine/threonine protein kinase
MLMENILGKGRYGKVYKAVHVDDPNKIFAVKVIKLESPKIREECLK